jgi:hypothetical protein
MFLPRENGNKLEDILWYEHSVFKGNTVEKTEASNIDTFVIGVTCFSLIYI